MNIGFVNSPQQQPDHVRGGGENIGPLWPCLEALAQRGPKRGIAERQPQRIRDSAAIVMSNETRRAARKPSKHDCAGLLVLSSPVHLTVLFGIVKHEVALLRPMNVKDCWMASGDV